RSRSRTAVQVSWPSVPPLSAVLLSFRTLGAGHIVAKPESIAINLPDSLRCSSDATSPTPEVPGWGSSIALRRGPSGPAGSVGQALLEVLELVLHRLRQPLADELEVAVDELDLVAPRVLVDRQELLDGLPVQVQPGQVERVRGRDVADRRLDRIGGARHALEHPLEDPAVVTEAR